MDIVGVALWVLFYSYIPVLTFRLTDSSLTGFWSTSLLCFVSKHFLSTSCSCFTIKAFRRHHQFCRQHYSSCCLIAVYAYHSVSTEILWYQNTLMKPNQKVWNNKTCSVDVLCDRSILKMYFDGVCYCLLKNKTIVIKIVTRFLSIIKMEKFLWKSTAAYKLN